MGIDTSAYALIGLHYNDLAEWIEVEEEKFYEVNPDDDEYGAFDAQEHMYCLGLTIASPWYDAELESCYIGVAVDDVDPHECNVVVSEVSAQVKKAADKFKKITGKDGGFIVTPHIY